MGAKWGFTLLSILFVPTVLARGIGLHNASTHALKPHYLSKRSDATIPSSPLHRPSRTRVSSSHKTVLHRQHREKRAILDICASIDASLLVDTARLLDLGDPNLNIDTNLNLCLCLKDLDIWLNTDANASILTELLGRSPLKLILELLLNTSPTARICTLPLHAHRICNKQDPCLYQCDPGWESQGDHCICPLPSVICRGECHSSCPSPQPVIEPRAIVKKLTPVKRSLHKNTSSKACNIDPYLRDHILSLAQLVIELRSHASIEIRVQECDELTLAYLLLLNSTTVQELLASVTNLATSVIRLRSVLTINASISGVVNLIVNGSLALQSWCATHSILDDGSSNLYSPINIGVGINLDSLGLGGTPITLSSNSPLSVNATVAVDLAGDLHTGTAPNVSSTAGLAAALNISLPDGSLSLFPLLLNSSTLFTSGLLSPLLASDLSSVIHVVLDTGSLIEGVLSSSPSIAADFMGPLLNATSCLLQLSTNVTTSAELLPSVDAVLGSVISIRTTLLNSSLIHVADLGLVIRCLDAILDRILQLQISLNHSSDISGSAQVDGPHHIDVNATGTLQPFGLATGLLTTISGLGAGLEAPINSMLGGIGLGVSSSISTSTPASSGLGLTVSLSDLLHTIVEVRLAGITLVSTMGTTNATLAIVGGINDLIEATVGLTTSGDLIHALDIAFLTLSQLGVTLDSASGLDLGAAGSVDLIGAIRSSLRIITQVRMTLADCGCSGDGTVLDTVTTAVDAHIVNLGLLKL